MVDHMTWLGSVLVVVVKRDVRVSSQDIDELQKGEFLKEMNVIK